VELADEDREFLRLFLMEKKVSAIKLHKDLDMCTLRQSMDYIARLINKLDSFTSQV